MEAETMHVRIQVSLILMQTMLLVYFSKGVIAPSCSVNPTESVVIVGEMTSIDCVAIEPYIVDSWIQGKAVTEGTKIYQVPAYRRDGIIRVNESLADGYFISYKEDHRITLQMNETTLWQAGPYLCECEGDEVGVARANVGVVDFVPNFITRSREDITEGDKVEFICSISFNGSADASFDLFINDSNGKTISRQSNLLFSFDKKSYHVNHSVNADANVDQVFTCTVKVINGSSKNVIYSKTVKASLLWEPVSEVFINCSTKSCPLKKAQIGDKLRCNANGRPRPTVFKWWKISRSGKGNASPTEYCTEYLVLDEIGHFTYRCYTYNVIRNVTYEALSSDFNINAEIERGHPEFGCFIGLSLASTIIVALTGIIIFMYKKLQHYRLVANKYRSAGEVGTRNEDNKVFYASLSEQRRLEERQREQYTEITLPTSSNQDKIHDYTDIIM